MCPTSQLENKMLKFERALEKIAFLKTAVEAFDAGDFLSIFLRFWVFRGLFDYKTVAYIKKVLFYIKLSICKGVLYSISIFKKGKVVAKLCFL